jgi:hypothetical protein
MSILDRPLCFLTAQQLQIKTKRRQQISCAIYNLWTRHGADLSGLAPPIFDGRFDFLSSYVIEFYTVYDNENHFSSAGVSSSDTSFENKVDNVHSCDLSYDDFCELYMYRNIPVVVRGLAENWPCKQVWVRKDSLTEQSVPNLSYINEHFGTDVVPVHEQPCAGFMRPQQRPAVSISHEMTIAEYTRWWMISQKDDSGQPLMYLKDWKFVFDHPNYDSYDCPHLFRDDWLNDAKDGTYKYVFAIY